MDPGAVLRMCMGYVSFRIWLNILHEIPLEFLWVTCMATNRYVEWEVFIM